MNTDDLQQSTLYDENGVPVIYAKECVSFPDDVSLFITKPEDLNRVNNLVSQSLQGIMNTQGRTIELIFEPHIQKGLKEGSLRMMKTKAGETLADAVHNVGKNTGQIAGKGRIIEAGKLKQLATGSFQVVSLIVAQAHLADINKSLTEIKTAIESLHDKINSHNLAKINGRIHYLEGIIEKMHRGDFDYEISLQIKNKIEDTVADAYEWQSILLHDLKNLKSNVDNLKDSDTFGTGDTYQNLKKLAEETYPLITRRNVLLKMASLLTYIQSCIDPIGKNFSQFDLMNDMWNLNLNNLASSIGDKANTLLSKARFNSQEILDFRRFFITKTLEFVNNSANHNYEQFESSLIKLKNNHNKILSKNGKLRLTVTHDNNGNIQKAAIID
ncbi:hypothetical protein [Morganella morganii]|uniref:hypothetical protein n=1 Tax=Morganella morganii TaxID=582 RepID=UPI0034D5B7CA